MSTSLTPELKKILSDWRENGIATDLVEVGIPKEDIVLAFHEPKIRQYPDFPVA